MVVVASVRDNFNRIELNIKGSDAKNTFYQLKNKYEDKNLQWRILSGSVLNKQFISSLWKYDVVYSWWVLHHTWDMYKAFENILSLIKPKWLFCVAIYNDFNGLPFSSKTWLKIKKFYSLTNMIFKSIIKFVYSSMVIWWLMVHWINPYRYIRDYDTISARWMNFWNDIEDWLWWYPFEYASVEQIDEYFEKKWFKRINLKETKREWCNEFLFKKVNE